MTELRLGVLDDSAIEPWRASIQRTTGMDVDRETLRTRVAASGRWDDHGANFGIWRGDSALGLVQGVLCPRMRDPGHVEVGILVFDPDARGQGIGTEAFVLWLDHLFVERGAFRVSFLTQPGNERMVRLGERCGFRLEGVVRGSVMVEGTPHDELLYGLTRDDPRPSPR